MKWNLKAIALALAIVPSTVIADVSIHTVSLHMVSKGVNNFNPGVGYDIKSARVGILYNSFKRPSVYALGIIDITPILRIGAGVIRGYSFDTDNTVITRDDNHWMPLVAVEVDITKSLSLVWFGDAINVEYKF